MRYVVEIRVRAESPRVELEKALKVAYHFADNPQWALSGMADAVELAADLIAAQINFEVSGTPNQEDRPSHINKPQSARL